MRAKSPLEAPRVQAARRRLAPIQGAYPFTPHFIDHDGVQQHYLDEGPRQTPDGHDAPALIFVHGNPTWSFAWRTAIAHLSDRYRCIAPDHVGCGLSDRPGDQEYHLVAHIERLERLLLGLDLERITLVLHDWGGAIGMGFARRHPERIARLVLLNTAAFTSSRIPLRIAMCRLPLLGALAVRGLNGFARAATFMAVERPLSRATKRGYLLPYDNWKNRAATHAFVQDIPMDPAHPSWKELLAIEKSLEVFRDRPAALFWGERDWCFTPHFREEWQAHLPQAEVYRFEEAGHYLFEDARQELVQRIDDFLGRHPLTDIAQATDAAGAE